MSEIISFIVANYVWIIVGITIVLLALIGSYVDKSRFGGKKFNQEELDKINAIKLSNVTLQQKINSINNVEEKDETEKVQDESLENLQETNIINDDNADQNTDERVINKIDEEKIQRDYEELNKKFKEVIPEKNIINDDLLYDVEALKLDKTQKFKFTDIPELDDIKLPDIKNEKHKIWK